MSLLQSAGSVGSTGSGQNKRMFAKMGSTIIAGVSVDTAKEQGLLTKKASLPGIGGPSPTTDTANPNGSLQLQSVLKYQ